MWPGNDEKNFHPVGGPETFILLELASITTEHFKKMYLEQMKK